MRTVLICLLATLSLAAESFSEARERFAAVRDYINAEIATKQAELDDIPKCLAGMANYEANTGDHAKYAGRKRALADRKVLLNTEIPAWRESLKKVDADYAALLASVVEPYRPKFTAEKPQ